MKNIGIIKICLGLLTSFGGGFVVINSFQLVPSLSSDALNRMAYNVGGVGVVLVEAPGAKAVRWFVGIPLILTGLGTLALGGIEFVNNQEPEEEANASASIHQSPQLPSRGIRPNRGDSSVVSGFISADTQPMSPSATTYSGAAHESPLKAGFEEGADGQIGQSHPPTITSHKSPLKDEESAASIFEEIARNRTHLMFAATTDSGKTTTLRAAVQAVANLYPEVIWRVIDPKFSSWLGLENQSGVVNYVENTPASVQNAFSVLQDIVSELETRKKQRHQAEKTGQPYNPIPLYLVIDEWLGFLNAVNRQHGKKMREEVISLVEVLLFQGREDLIRVWIVSHTHFVQKNGLDAGSRAQFRVWAQGRNGCFDSLEHALADPWLIPNNQTRIELATEFKTKRYSFSANSPPVAYTNLGGARLVQLPFIPPTALKGGDAYVEATEATNLSDQVLRSQVMLSVIQGGIQGG